MTYAEKLLDPRWQRKKNEILIRDNYTCQYCANTVNTLHVHHLDYIGGIDPWDYPDDILLTLCKGCHDKENGRIELQKDLATTLKMKGFLYDDLLALSSAIDTNDDFRNYLHSYLRKFKNG